MKEIKFRGLSTITGQWIYGDLIQRTTDFIFPSGVYTTKIYEYLIEIRPETKSEYTGLKDKNGAEIYEGDILSTDLDRPYLIVEFRNGAFMFQCHDNGKDYYDFMATTGENSNFTKYHEVIGNIYENPELLEDN